MSGLARQALATIERHAMLREGNRVLTAVSAGADSVALLFVLRELEAAGALTIAGVAHLNHQLRGADADADEAFCRTLAARLDLPFVSERVDVGAIARAEKRSLEDAARTARYAFLDRAADGLNATAIAVAHTVEDQAETFLLRLLRGSGTRGLAAIRPRTGLPTEAPAARRWVIRPLLDIERAALREYLAALGETFRDDRSNADVSFMRNRVRHELIPLLQSRFSPAVTATLAREAALARQDEEFLSAEAIKLASEIVLQDVSVRIDAARLRSAPRALSSRVAHAALQRLAGPKSIHFEHVERLLELAECPAGPSRALSLPGQDAVRTGETIVLRPVHRSARRKGREREGGEGGLIEDVNRFAISLSIPGEVELVSQGLAVGAEPLPGTGGRRERPTSWAARGMEVGVAAGALELPLAIRSRRPGDRFHPLGAPGRRKLQDFLVDRKVPRDERDRVPVVVDGRDRIVWVVGQSVAEEFRVTDPSQGVILLKVRHLGGVG